MTFRVGDRVQCIRVEDGNESVRGAVGTVRDAPYCSDSLVGVEFDHRITEGHTLNGRCGEGFGWRCAQEALELLVTYQERNQQFVTSEIRGREATSFLLDDWYDLVGSQPTPPKPVQPRTIGEFFKRLSAAEGK